MDINEMTLEQIEARKAEIRELIKDENADFEALNKEVDAMEVRKAEITQGIESRKALLAKVASSSDVTIIAQPKKEERKMNETYNIESPEYRSAFFKKLAGNPLTEIEERAFTETTATFGGSLPKVTSDKIWSNIQRDHSLINDINVYSLGAMFEVTVAQSVAAGKAAKVAEGVANADLKITYIKKTLSGNDYAATAYISYAMGSMNGQALEDFLVDEIYQQLGDAMADDIVAHLGMAINATNKKTLATISFAELAKVFGLISQKGEIKVYLNNKSLYESLVSMVDTQGRPIFQPNAQITAEGAFIGATLRKESSVGANKILIGVPQAITGNFVTNPMIERDKDITAHKHVFSGYARFEAVLKNDLAFVEVTIGSGS